MRTATSVTQNLSATIQPLLGRPADDAELRNLLTALGHWPIPSFPSDEFIVYVENQDQGYSLQFDDAATVRSPVASGQPARTALLAGCFLYSEGADDYHAFLGSLPFDMTWLDSATAVIGKIGAPKYTIMNKKTNALSAHGWDGDTWSLSVKYRDGGRAIRHVHLGLLLQP